MAPNTVTEDGPVRVTRTPVVESPDDIVISGISIRCSQSDNIEEFADNLFNKVNMVHENLERCDEDWFGVPKQHGFIKDIRKFDATFFGVHPKQAEGMDPQLRILHEVAYESIIDGGVDPASLKNSNTGVFIGTSNSDAREAWTSADVSEIDGYSLIGTHRAFLANRLSFTFDLRGPSFGVDAACATSGVAINQGYLHIKNNVCDAAIVGGVSLVYQPKVSYQILKLGLLCKDGKCKVFDEAADGYVRAEAIASILLQRRKDAKRIYATLVHSKINNDGFKEQGITFPSTESQGQLITEVYSEAGIDPEDVEYVEAHGTGTTIGDPQETNGIALAFVNNRTKPLPIGAVKSNMGHSEHASGAVSVCKLMIAMQRGVIPPNLHFNKPNPLIPGLVDGRLKVVTEPMKWNSTIAGVNCFGFGGQNSHTVLRGNPNVRTETINDPRLFVYMGRTEEGARVAMDYVHRYPDNPYVPYLLMNSAHAKPASMPYRGYTIINTNEPPQVVERVSTEVRPVWFVFSGQGTQWASMGRDILRLPAFATSIEKCTAALKPFGLDLVKILAESTEEDFDDPTISFVGIAAIQIALVDLLNKMKITAEGFVGHSAGEIGCAYADGGFTAEEAMMAAYWRGRAVKEAKLAAGSMAAVGLSWAEATKRCPPTVTPACNNAKDNVTISGPAEDVKKFVEQLSAEKVFAKEVKSYGIAFHSPAMQKAAPTYLSELKKVLVSPKLRTTRWLSTAVDEKEWGSDLARYASAEYFAHNLTTSVKFHEALTKVPSNAVVIEVAPHGLLQALIKATVGSQSVPVSLLKRGHSNNLNFFYEAIGKLYVNGLNPFVNELYPTPSLPAPRDTPFIGSVVRWDHSAFWRIPYPTDFIHKGGKSGAQHKFTYDLSDPLNSGLLDHKLGAQATFPVGSYLAMVAKAFAVETGNTVEKAPRLTFYNLRFLQPVTIDAHGKPEFEVTVSKTTGRFEITYGDKIVVTGEVETAASDALDNQEPGNKPTELTTDDVVREFQFRGYQYGPRYQLLAAADSTGTYGVLGNGSGYETAVDGLLQLLAFSQATRNTQQVTEIQSVTIDIPRLAASIQSGLTAQAYPTMNLVTAAGAEVEGVTFTPIPTGDVQNEVTVQSYGFIPNTGAADAELGSKQVLQPALDLAIENITDRTEPVQVLELVKGDAKSNLTNASTGLHSLTTVPTEFKTITIRTGQQTEINPGSANIILAENYFTDATALSGDLRTLSAIAKEDGFVLLTQTSTTTTGKVAAVTLDQLTKALTTEGFQVAFTRSAATSNLVLARRVTETPQKHVTLPLPTNPEQAAQTVSKKLQEVLTEPGAEATTRIWLVAPKDGQYTPALLDQLASETGSETLRLVLGEPTFNPATTPEVTGKDLRVSVKNGSAWGTYRYVPVTPFGTYTQAPSGVATLNPETRTLQLTSRPLPATGKKTHVAVAYAGLVGGSQEPKFVSFSGYTVPENKPVIGLVAPTALTTDIAVPADQLITVPSGIPSDKAATLPFSYGLAYYGLAQVARAARDQFAVLYADDAHAADLDAAIRTSTLLGLRVFIAGVSPKTEEHVRSQYPSLARNIFPSIRKVETANRILEFTNGHGVDVVYNASSANKLHESLRVMAPNGHYVQVYGGVPVVAPKNITVTTDLLKKAVGTNALTTAAVRGFLTQAMANLQPLPVTTYSSPQEVPTTFFEGQTQSAVVAVRPNGPTQPIHAAPGVNIQPEKVYLTTGDDTELAAKVAYWLTTVGARKIVLATPTPASPALLSQQRYFTNQPDEPVVDIVTAKSVNDAVAAAAKHGAIGGVFYTYETRYTNAGFGGSFSLEGLDQATRTQPKGSVEQFVVLTSAGNDTNVQRTVDSRSAAGLPVKVLNVPTLASPADINITPTPNNVTVRQLLEALPSALLSTGAVVSVVPVQRAEQKRGRAGGDDEEGGPRDKSFLPQAVARIMGIKDFGSLDMFLSLGDYGIDSLMAMELGQILERDFDLSLTLQEIRALCVRDICLMSGSTNAVEAASKMDATKSQDFETPTLLDNTRKHYNLHELVPKTTTVMLRQVKERNEKLFIAHPMEGAVLPVLETLANHLQVTTYGLNHSSNADSTTIASLATHYIQEMKKIQPQGPYNIGGYSFGAGVAFEMALQLQAENPTSVQNLVLLDGSHSFVGAFTKTMKSGYTVDPNMPIEEMNARKQAAFEVAIFVLFVTQFVKTARKILTEKLQAARNFDERVKVVVQELKRCPAFAETTEESIDSAARNFAQRLFIADQYKPAHKFNGDVTLIRCSEKMIRNLGDLYELDKVCTQRDRLSAYTVPGNHEGFVLGESAKTTASYINAAVLKH